jgi:hypothetical protein
VSKESDFCQPKFTFTEFGIQLVGSKRPQYQS